MNDLTEVDVSSELKKILKYNFIKEDNEYLGGKVLKYQYVWNMVWKLNMIEK